MRHSMVGLAAIAVVLFAVNRPMRAAPTSNVLLVTIDTLRADRVGAYGYSSAATPTLDTLARTGVRFADAVAHVPLTFPSHVSLMTGRYPGAFGIRVNGSAPLPDHATTLAEQMREAGYATGAFVGSVILDGSLGLDQGFDRFDDDMAMPAGDRLSLIELQRPAADVAAAAERWIGQQKSRWFAWVHFYDPHLPYAAPPEYQRRLPKRPYDAEVAYVDAMLGRLLTGVDRSQTVVVVTSDHGEGLGDHGELDHGFFIYDATLKVPLIIAGPGISSRVVNEQVRLVDLPPTVLALTGVAARDDTTDGVSLLPLVGGEARREVPASLAESWYPRLHFGWSELRGLRVGEFMFISAPRPELYDLRTDPRQESNIIERRSPVAARMASELAAIGPASPDRQTPTPQPDPDTVRRLQALGYVGSFAPVTAGRGDDPKAHIDDYRKYRDLLNRALGALDRGRPETAIPLLQALVKLNVRAFEAHHYLGSAYAASGKLEAALGEYEAALQLNPDVSMPRIEMAELLQRQGKTDRAVGEVRTVLAREPRSFFAWYTLGVIELKSGRQVEAFKAFQRASELNPRDPRTAANYAEAAMRVGQTGVAQKQLQQMIALGHRVAPAHYNLGLLAEQAGDLAGAQAHYRAALKADPSFEPARKKLRK